ncbi:MAG: T9SS type A sorting domain-containing protein [Bacteroidales bacterium]
MLKGGYFILLLMVGISGLSGQVVSHKVLVPLASTWQNENYFVSQTVGEPVVMYLHTESNDLTQGFQQPCLILHSIVTPQGNGVLVYPNPVQERLSIEMYGDFSVEYHITIFGLDGSVFFRKDYPCNGQFWRIETIDVTEFKRGLYFVRVETTPRKIERLFKIEKM